MESGVLNHKPQNVPLWIEAVESSRYGVAIFNFRDSGCNRLPLDVGDTVNIICHTDDWYYGFKTKNHNRRGIFPKKFVCVRESVVDRSGPYEVVLPVELPIVNEITAVLREWGRIWRELYMHSKRTQKANFGQIHKSMLELIDYRRLIMSKKLPLDEMKEYQQKVTSNIDMGNAQLGLDLVIRDERGNMVDPMKNSTVNLHRLHQVATKRIDEERGSVTKNVSCFSLYVNVKNFVCRIGEHADILLTLYDAKEGLFISDNYIMKWGNHGMPKDIDMLNNLRAIFTDLSLKDTLREKVFLVCQIIRIGRMDLKEADSKRQAKGMRRPFGVAAVEVTGILNGKSDSDGERQYFVPFLQCGERDFMENIIKKAITAREINHKGQGLWVSMCILHGDLTQIQKDYPHIVTTTTAIARKMGFPDVILPGDIRNDLYVTLMQGEFRKGGKVADKNVEVTLTVCNGEGEVIENVISEGAGGDLITQYKSIIYYHEDKPRWFETVKLAIPINQFYSSHLKFTFKHRSTSEAKDRSEKNFAMCYIRLMNDDGTTLGDTVHQLIMYRIDPKKPDDTSSTYFQLPSTVKELRPSSSVVSSPKSSHASAGGLSQNPADAFQISTLVCSTKLTHNVDLMGLLKWRDNLGTLAHHLQAFMTDDGEEIVKFLQDVLDALFNILMENTESGKFDNLVFEALIFLFGIISDHKYRQFRPVLDLYIHETFSAALAYRKLMAVLKSYIDDVKRPSKIETLHKIMNSLEYVFKFIVRSRDLFAAFNENKEKKEFETLLSDLFSSINQLVRHANESTLSLCETVLKNLPSIITDIITVSSPHEFSEVLVTFLKSIPTDRLARQKMQCINDLVHSPLFLISDCRRILLPVLLSHVESLLSNHEELAICIKILSDIMDLLHNAERLINLGDTDEDLKTVSLSMLRVIIQTVIYMMEHGIRNVDDAVAVLTSILRQMTEQHYEHYIQQFETTSDLNDFLMEILMVIEDLVRRNVYQADWNEMIMLQNWVFLKALKYFSAIIQTKYKNPFIFEIWRRIFFSMIAFLTQTPLQLELFSEVKRSKILSRYKDMRREGGFEIRSLWFTLGPHKIEFIPEIVGLVLEMTLIPEPELRRHTIPIFFDMMLCEFMSLKPNSKQHVRNFNKFEQEVITKLDELVAANHGDKDYQELFFDIVKEKCEQHLTMRDMGLKFVDTIKQLMQLLLEYRDVVKEDNLDNKMSCTVSLLNFYHDIGRRELYLQYLHRLCQLHLEAENYTEAAFTLIIYAKHLQWSNSTILPYLISSKYPEETLHRNLKERIYYDIISYFDQGKMWEKGIEVCKELAVQYETQTFDYLRLSITLRKQAELYDSIMTKVRPEPEYFRVGYYGIGFPSFLQLRRIQNTIDRSITRTHKDDHMKPILEIYTGCLLNKELLSKLNRVYIYRGKEYERLSDFTARLQNQFPNAQLLKTLSPPSEDIKKQPNQYLQINKVTPILELKNHLLGKQLNDQILKYYKVNDVQKFTYSRKKDESTNDPANMWLERTNLVTSYPFPGLLHWFPVTSTHTFDVSPLELAIEVIDETSDKIRSLIDQHLADPTLRVDPLGMVLHGVVDAAVNGGIANYKVFYTDDYLKSRETETAREHITRLRQGTKHQLLLLKKALDIHRGRAPESLLPFQAHLEQRYSQMKNVLEAEYGIKVTDEEYQTHGPDVTPITSVKRVQSMPASRHIASNRLSDTLPPQRILRLQAHLRPNRNTSGPLTPSIIATPATPSLLPSVAEAKSIMRAFSTFNVSSLTSSDSASARSAQRKSIPSQRDSVISGNSVSSLGKSDTKDGSVIELSQELTPMRPLRPDDSKGRSGSLVRQVRAVTMTPCTSPLESPDRDTAKSSSVMRTFEEPPPLPEKSSQADYANLATADESPPIPPGSCLMRRGTHKDRPHIPEPTLVKLQVPSKKVAKNEAPLETRSLNDDENLF